MTKLPFSLCCPYDKADFSKHPNTVNNVSWDQLQPSSDPLKGLSRGTANGEIDGKEPVGKKELTVKVEHNKSPKL